MGPHAYYLIIGISKKQGAVSFSIPEAGMVAGCFGYMKAMLPSLDLWSVIAPQMATPQFHEGNRAMVMIIMSIFGIYVI